MKIENVIDLSDLPMWYGIKSSDVRVETVNLRWVIPTQTFLDGRTLRRYLNRTKMVDRDGDLPLGLRFAESNYIYLLDGHHRWYACQQKGRKRFRLWIDEYPYSLQEAYSSSIAPSLSVSLS